MMLNRLAASEVRAEMARQGIKPRDLVSQVPFSQASLSRKLNGQREFTVEELGYTAHALGLSGSELLARAEAAALKETR